MYDGKVIFNNTLGWSSVFAVFTNGKNVKTVSMLLLKNELYICSAFSNFDDVYFTNGAGVCTVHTSFNSLCYAFEPNGHSFSGIVCLHLYEDGQKASTNTTDITVDYSDGLKKTVHIWTPNGYNSDSPEKYGVIYMFDGQNLFSDSSTAFGCWNVPQIMSQRGDYIVVAIDNSDKNRDNQLTPNIGKTREMYSPVFSNGTGAYMAQFVVSKIIPYINKNYNVFTDKEHTAVCGSSSGGLESFYMGMTYEKIFGVVGALSPAFVIFDNNVWQEFLQSVDIKNAPRLYLYTGASDIVEKELYPPIVRMRLMLKSQGYDKNKMVYDCKKYNYHNEACWSGAFAKFMLMLG